MIDYSVNYDDMDSDDFMEFVETYHDHDAYDDDSSVMWLIAR